MTDEPVPRRARSALNHGSSDSSTCGGITHEGCCDGQQLYYCDSGVVIALDCSQNPSCGWDATASYYNCGTSGQPDPSGAHPKTCAAVPNTGCGTVSLWGCCHGEVLYYCENNALKSFDCSQYPSCGWDPSMGYSCGTAGSADPGGTHPKACAFDAAVPDTGPGPDLPACGSVAYEGCCHGEMLFWCGGNGLLSYDCSGMPSCGWNPSVSHYVCGTNGSADPSGTHPKPCAFDAAVAVPDTGSPDAALSDIAAWPCGSMTWEGCCDGETVKFCQWGNLVVMDCSGQPSCGWDTIYHHYDCNTDGKPDPSGTYPKACTSPPDGGVPCGAVTLWGCCDGQTRYRCVDGSLQVEDCRRQPSCGWGLAGYSPYYKCGEQGLPDPKGTIPMACDFGDAGPPAIGNSCGSITWQGCCAGQTLHYCDAGTPRWKDCGTAPLCGWKTSGDYSFYDCGTDGNADPSGQLPKACPADAGVPDASAACGPVTHKGCCEGDTLYWCASGTLNSMDCSKSPSCGWQPAADYYDCDTDGNADPTGTHPMACGFDGGAPVLDQGPRDAAAPRDAKRDSPPAGDLAAPADDGCGCVLVPRSPGGVTLLLLLLVVVAIRRRPRC